ncbi:MAG: hypothetical protein KDC44_21175, partial [Phaeodactylibacter sp.]|nr:hypothetical protein [Phaeodactylibacter sp.]
HQYRGLTAETLKILPEGIFQIGQEDSNTKGYFIYTATAATRRIRLRFGLWSQYHMELHGSKERLEIVQRFFHNFENFERATQASISTLFLFYDENTGFEVDLLLQNGKKITRQNRMGMLSIRPQFFLELLHEIQVKTGQ